MPAPPRVAVKVQWLSWLLLFSLAARAAVTDAAIWTPPTAVQFESLSLSDGLSDSTIFSVSQDRQGRIWLGSASGGANVYDGYEIHYFVHDPTDPQSLSHSAGGEVLATSGGLVLVGTWGGGLNRMGDIEGRFTRLNPEAAPTHIQVLAEDAAGQVWVGSADSGLYRLDPQSGDLVAVSAADGQPLGRIWSIATAPGGELWVATEAGVYALAEGRWLTEPVGGWNNHPRALLHAQDALWIGDEESVYRVAPEGLPVPVLRQLPLVNTLGAGVGEQILVGTLSGLRAVDGEGGVTAPFGHVEEVLFPERNIRRLLVDRGGVAWIATREAGVIKVQPTVSGFDGYRLESNLDTADAMLELAPDDVLVGSRRGLFRLRRIDGQTRFEHVPGSDAHPVNRLRLQGEGVLVGTRMGVYRFDPQSGQLRADPRYVEVAELMVTALKVGEDGRVDIGTWSGGLYRYGPDGLLAQHAPDTPQPLPDASIADIEPDGEGGIWVGLWSAGVAHIAADGQIRLIDRDRLAIDGTVHDLLLVDGALWIATGFGLARFDLQRGAGERLTLIPDYPNTAVQRLAHGGGRLWAATTRGVISIDPQDDSMTRFGSTDGLIVDEFFARSGDEGAQGRVYFGGLGGFVSFLPDQVALPLRPPAAAVVGAWADGEPIALQQPLRIPPGSGSLRLRYIAADYRNATANRFRWRLQGGDREASWSEVSAAPEALLTGLRPGNYAFELQAASGNGLWNRAAVSLPIEVLPAWWQTLWGQLGAVVAALLLAWLWNYWNTQRIRLRNRALQREVGLQTEALREANASLAIAAFTDYLTGLLNRRGFLSRIDRLPDGEGEHYALIDADNFKAFNDIYGHDVGDLVLQHLAECLRRAARAEDLAARWGGEEFILCFRDATEAEAKAIAERVRQVVASQPLKSDRELPAITVTIGLARRRPKEPPIQAINRADECLLKGKEQGKNRVVAEA